MTVSGVCLTCGFQPSKHPVNWKSGASLRNWESNVTIQKVNRWLAPQMSRLRLDHRHLL